MANNMGYDVCPGCGSSEPGRTLYQCAKCGVFHCWKAPLFLGSGKGCGKGGLECRCGAKGSADGWGFGDIKTLGTFEKPELEAEPRAATPAARTHDDGDVASAGELSADDAVRLPMAGMTLSAVALMLHGQEHSISKTEADKAVVEFLCADGKWYAKLILMGSKANHVYEMIKFTTHWPRDKFTIPSMRAINKWNEDESLTSRLYIDEDGDAVLTMGALVGNVSLANVLALNAAWDADVKAVLQMFATRDSYVPSPTEATEWLTPELIGMALEPEGGAVTHEVLDSGNHRYKVVKGDNGEKNYTVTAESIRDDDSKIWRLMFSAWWPAGELSNPSQGDVARWNKETRVGRFYIDDDGDVRVEMEQCVQHASSGNVVVSATHWEGLLTSVGNREGIFAGS